MTFVLKINRIIVHLLLSVNVDKCGVNLSLNIMICPGLNMDKCVKDNICKDKFRTNLLSK